MEILATQIVNGLTRGAEYALIAAGLALIFGVLRIVNFAHGEFYLLGAYSLYFSYAVLQLPYPAAAAVAMLAMVGFGAVFYVVVLHRIVGISWQLQLVATIAASIMLVNLVIVLSGALPRYVPSPLTEIVVSVGGVRFSVQRILVIVAAISAFAGLFVMLTYTKLGKAMRALSQNRDACEVVGIPVHKVGIAAVMIGSALAGVAAVTIPPLTIITPEMALFPTLKAFAAVIMGGFGNVQGAVTAAFALGIVEALGIGYVSAEYGEAIVFGAMILTLLLRPHGLFGKALRI